MTRSLTADTMPPMELDVLRASADRWEVETKKARARVAELEAALTVALCWCPACDGRGLMSGGVLCVVCDSARVALGSGQK